MWRDQQESQAFDWGFGWSCSKNHMACPIHETPNLTIWHNSICPPPPPTAIKQPQEMYPPDLRPVRWLRARFNTVVCFAGMEALAWTPAGQDAAQMVEWWTLSGALPEHDAQHTETHTHCFLNRTSGPCSDLQPSSALRRQGPTGGGGAQYTLQPGRRLHPGSGVRATGKKSLRPPHP